MLLRHQGKLRQFEFSLHLSVDGNTHWPGSPALGQQSNQDADEKSTTKLKQNLSLRLGRHGDKGHFDVHICFSFFSFFC